MGKFFPDGVVNPASSQMQNPLRAVVRDLSPKAKQAMLAVLKSGKVMRRATWDGCAFNLASGGLSGANAVAAALHTSVDSVSKFILRWDSLEGNDRACSDLLLQALQEVGTHTPVGFDKSSRAGQIIRGYAFKSEATKFAEQLESGELTVEMIPGCEAAEALLVGAGA
jgi:hypothetical protein